MRLSVLKECVEKALADQGDISVQVRGVDGAVYSVVAFQWGVKTPATIEIVRVDSHADTIAADKRARALKGEVK